MIDIEQMADDYAKGKVPNPGPNDAPYYTTGEKYDDIKDAYIAGMEEAYKKIERLLCSHITLIRILRRKELKGEEKMYLEASEEAHKPFYNPFRMRYIK